MSTSIPKFYLYRGDIYEEVEDQYLTRFKKADIQPITLKSLHSTWKGAKIPFEVWSEIMAFMVWSQKTFESEAHITLWFNQDTGEWAAEPYAQTTSGLSVTTLGMENITNREIRLKYGDHWVEFGSVHHHCNISAHQSGTDRQDEQDRDGLHITLGKLDDAVKNVEPFDHDIRLVYDGEQYEPEIWEFVDLPYEGLMEALEQSPISSGTFCKVLNEILLTFQDDMTFPKEWESRITKKVVTYPPTQAYLGGSYGALTTVGNTKKNNSPARRDVPGRNVPENKWANGWFGD